jgi:hypothetical protein
MAADSLLQKLIYLDKVLRDKECDAYLRSEIMQAQQDVLGMQQEMLRLMSENEQLRSELAVVKPKPAAGKARTGLFSKAS